MSIVDPFQLLVQASDKGLRPYTTYVERRLGDMTGMYADSEAERAKIDDTNPLIYEVHQYDVPEETGQLFVSTTILYPGSVGDEFYMTKGHYHEVRDRAEVYIGTGGTGLIVMMLGDRFEAVELTAGSVTYVPPHWAHRSVNIGDDPFSFLAVYPGDAGHDYGSIESTGFNHRILKGQSSHRVVEAAST